MSNFVRFLAGIFACGVRPCMALVLDTVELGGNGCATDGDCADGSTAIKCCPTDGKQLAGCGGRKPAQSAQSKQCILPALDAAAPVTSKCACVAPGGCIVKKDMWPYEAVKADKKQWLMIGDSITLNGVHDNVKDLLAAEHSLQMVHVPDNAGNIVWGLACLEHWVVQPHRWDVISFNFGLHDVSLTVQRVEPDLYGKLLGKFVKRLHELAPKATLLWATTTPVPLGSDGPCVGIEGGCPPRRAWDVKRYNNAAAQSLNSTSFPVKVLDLYGAVVGHCVHGEGQELYHDCKEKQFQYPTNVHFFRTGGGKILARRYVEAAKQAAGIGKK